MGTKEKFIRDYVKEILQGNAAVFAGAGLSRSSGFVNWKELLQPLANDIGLNIEYEYDLTKVAQYIKNKNGNRDDINNSILSAFGTGVELNESVRILTRLPIKTYWTTNYDHLLEDGLKEAQRNPDVKIEYKQLSMTKKDTDAIVYKMHGDVDHPADAVLTKDDYVKYNKTHPFFRNFLQGDLISKSFLFVGFSFEDPNLNFVLDQIRLVMDENIHNHYCFVKKINTTDCKNEEEFQGKETLETLREEYLKKYGIQTVFVDDYKEIPDILKEVEAAVLANNVFISGSATFYDNGWSKERVEKLADKLANELVKAGFKVTSGFGLGIGSSVINGALKAIYAGNKHSDDYLRLKPFSQNINAEEKEAKHTQYREDFLKNNGVAIFMFGNKKDDLSGEKVLSNGCRQEFDIAKAKGCRIIPIGSTGDMAEKIYAEVKSEHEADRSKYAYLDNYMTLLGTETDIDKIVDAVLEIVKIQRKG